MTRRNLMVTMVAYTNIGCFCNFIWLLYPSNYINEMLFGLYSSIGKYLAGKFLHFMILLKMLQELYFNKIMK